MTRRVFCLMGPTASGKTDAAMRLADELRGRQAVDLISVDSAMVYRGMDIGTAKPPPDVLERYPHALVDVREPTETFSAAAFVAGADRAAKASLDGGRMPLLVGGTMLYFRAFRDGLAPLPPADDGLRADIAARAERQGWPALYRELELRDAAAAAVIDPANGQRIQRALEVLEVSGRSITSFWRQPSAGAAERLACELVEVRLAPGARDELHRRIEARLDRMLASGFVDEVERLRRIPGLDASAPSMRTVGYRQVWGFLDGDYGEDEMRARAAAATRQLAKKQLTWLRGWPGAAAEAGSAAEAAGRMRRLWSGAGGGDAPRSR